MPTRRDILTLATSAVAAPRTSYTSSPTRPERSFLQKRLFNFKPTVSPKAQQEMLARLAALSKSNRLGGFMFGQNIVTVSWPTRFDWIYMAQLDPMQAAATAVPNTVGLSHDVLTSHCSSSVVCEMPMVKRYLVEPSARNAAYPDQMQWQVTGDFASMADYQAYAQASVHLAIRKDFSGNTTRVTFLDFTV